MTSSNIAEWPQVTKLSKYRSFFATSHGHPGLKQYIGSSLTEGASLMGRFAISVKSLLQLHFIVWCEKNDNGRGSGKKRYPRSLRRTGSPCQ